MEKMKRMMKKKPRSVRVRGRDRGRDRGHDLGRTRPPNVDRDSRRSICELPDTGVGSTHQKAGIISTKHTE